VRVGVCKYLARIFRVSRPNQKNIRAFRRSEDLSPTRSTVFSKKSKSTDTEMSLQSSKSLLAGMTLDEEEITSRRSNPGYNPSSSSSRSEVWTSRDSRGGGVLQQGAGGLIAEDHLQRPASNNDSGYDPNDVGSCRFNVNATSVDKFNRRRSLTNKNNSQVEAHSRQLAIAEVVINNDESYRQTNRTAQQDQLSNSPSASSNNAKLRSRPLANNSSHDFHRTLANSNECNGTMDSGVHCSQLADILMEIRRLTDKCRHDEDIQEECNDWKFAAMVIDRMCLVMFTVFTVVSTCAILFSAPNLTSSF